MQSVVKACCCCNIPDIFNRGHIANCIDWSDVGAQRLGLVMSLDFTRQMSAREEGSAIDKIRELVAAHLEVDVSRVTDDAHLIEDLGADWLDRLELMILLEDHFAGLEITDSDADQIEFVGDLIRYIEDAMVGDGSTRGVACRPSVASRPL